MASRSGFMRCVAGLGRLRAVWTNKRGVAAIEFALMVPLLLSLYFVTMEVAQGIDTNKKVSRAGSMVADLITQQGTMNKSELEAIMKIGESILQPYNRSKPEIIVTAIEVEAGPPEKTVVKWSRKLVDGVYSQGPKVTDPVTLPTKLNLPGTFIIRVESKMGYEPVLLWKANQRKTLGLMGAFESIAMNEVYYLRPRVSPTIPCGDC